MLRRTLLLGVALIAPGLLAAPLPQIEPMPTLDSATLAPAALLNGTGYTVDASVPVVGYLGQFTLRAPSGTFTADGTEMLAIRVAELGAIAGLSRLSQTQVFTDALAQSAQKTGSAIARAVTNPVGTIEGIPAGVGRFFQSASKTVSRATESGGGSGSQEQAGSADAMKDVVGVNKAKRQIAKQVGADPYTTNPVLAKQLDDLAWAAFAGGVSLDVALSVTTAGVATAISTTASISNLVWDAPPEDIRTINEGKLAKMGVGADAIRAFVTNRWFPPTLSVPFVDALAELAEAKGRPAVVALAGSVGSEVEARYLLNAVTMARKAAAEDRVVALDLAGRIVVAHMKSGRLVVPAPVDYVVWTEAVKRFAERKDLRGKAREILVTGSASELTHAGLAATGWKLHEHSAR